MLNAIHSGNASEIIGEKNPRLRNLIGRVRAWLFGRSPRTHRSPSPLNLARERSRNTIEGVVAWQYPGQGHQREQAIRVVAAELYVSSPHTGPDSMWL